MLELNEEIRLRLELEASEACLCKKVDECVEI